jgi:hypothetical protein
MTVNRLAWAVGGLGFLAFTALGLVFATVFATDFFPSPFGPPFGPSTDPIVYFAANRSQVQTMSFFYAVAALCLLVFVANCAGLLADVTPAQRDPLPWLAVGAGTLASGMWLVTALLLWILSRAESGEPALVRAIHDLSYLTGGPVHVLTLGVFLGAVSAALWRRPVLSWWIILVGLAAALFSLASVAALLWTPATFVLPLGRGLAMLWILLTSLTWIARQERFGVAQPGPTR